MALNPALARSDPTALPNVIPTEDDLRALATIGRDWQDQAVHEDQIAQWGRNFENDQDMIKYLWLSRQCDQVRNFINASIQFHISTSRRTTRIENAGGATSTPVSQAYATWAAEQQAADSSADRSVKQWLSSASVTVQLSAIRDAVKVTVRNSVGNNANIPAATTEFAGVMTSSDKASLDRVSPVGSAYALWRAAQPSAADSSAMAWIRSIIHSSARADAATMTF